MKLLLRPFSLSRRRCSAGAGAVLGALVLPFFLLMPANSRAQDDQKPAAAAEAKPADAAEAKPASAAGSDAGAEKALLDRLSYAYGIVMSRQLTERGVELNIDKFIEAYKASVSGGELAMTDEELRDVFQEHEAMMSKKENEAGNTFLKENAAREGVKVTESGLQYEVVTQGDGAKPKATDTVEVHYAGTLTDGTEFDSSYSRGEPIEFPLDGVIPGWTEGVQLMSVGSKYRFVIPYDLAYGERGSPPAIPPKATLVFIVELLSIK